jgi:hypothetical protein
MNYLNSIVKEEIVLQHSLVLILLMLVMQVRLVTLYKRTGRINEGWQHCCEVEQMQPWPASREWYSCMVEMSENYQVWNSRNFLFLLIYNIFVLRFRTGTSAPLSSTLSTWPA